MKKRLARFKIYTERAKWYAAYIQFILMIAIWLNTSGFAMKWWYYPIVLVGSVCVFIVLGYFEVKSGMLRYEQEKYISENPGFDRVFKELQEIKDKL